MRRGEQATAVGELREREQRTATASNLGAQSSGQMHHRRFDARREHLRQMSLAFVICAQIECGGRRGHRRRDQKATEEAETLAGEQATEKRARQQSQPAYQPPDTNPFHPCCESTSCKARERPIG